MKAKLMRSNEWAKREFDTTSFLAALPSKGGLKQALLMAVSSVAVRMFFPIKELGLIVRSVRPYKNC